MASNHSQCVSGIRICSFNMRGYNNSALMARELCENHDTTLLQEHWLFKQDLDKLDNIHDDFIANGFSAMQDKTSSGILAGRLFGEVIILWNKTRNSYQYIEFR